MKESNKIFTTTKLKLIKARKFHSTTNDNYSSCGSESSEIKPKKSIYNNNHPRREIKLMSTKHKQNDSTTLPEVSKTIPNESIQNKTILTTTNLEEYDIETRKVDENNVKKLNLWEKDTLNKDLYNDDNFLSTKKDLESINWKNDIRQGLKKLSLTTNNFFSDFFKAGDQEQGSIMIQNLNVAKKKFNFNLFKDNKIGYTNTDNDHLETDEDFINKFDKLKNDDNYDNIVKADYYRNIIKEKMRLELSYTHELNKIAQKIFEAKKKKEKLTNDIFDIMNYMKEVEMDYNVN